MSNDCVHYIALSLFILDILRLLFELDSDGSIRYNGHTNSPAGGILRSEKFGTYSGCVVLHHNRLGPSKTFASIIIITAITITLYIDFANFFCFCFN
jgi:hypothetical protein